MCVKKNVWHMVASFIRHILEMSLKNLPQNIYFVHFHSFSGICMQKDNVCEISKSSHNSAKIYICGASSDEIFSISKASVNINFKILMLSL